MRQIQTLLFREWKQSIIYNDNVKKKCFVSWDEADKNFIIQGVKTDYL